MSAHTNTDTDTDSQTSVRTRDRTRTRLAVALATLLTLSLLAVGGLGGVAAADDDAECEPENTVTYDEFREDGDTIDFFESRGHATVEKENTEATVDADEAFVRLSVTNANSYCVEFDLELADDVVTAATLGSIGAEDADVNADWRATHDFDADETYTDVTVTVPAGTEATFAPSQLRVRSLSWTSDLESSGYLDRITSVVGIGTSPLDERTHTIAGNESEQITVPLTHPDDADESIDDWRATYTIEGEDRTQIMSQDTSNEVFYRTVDDGDALEIVFNEPAEVEFIAEPTIRDRISYQIDSYLSSLGDMFSSPLSSVDVSSIVGGVWP